MEYIVRFSAKYYVIFHEYKGKMYRINMLKNYKGNRAFILMNYHLGSDNKERFVKIYNFYYRSDYGKIVIENYLQENEIYISRFSEDELSYLKSVLDNEKITPFNTNELLDYICSKHKKNMSI